jgi:RNA polymerase sigma-70 factor (ECF subfamily)
VSAAVSVADATSFHTVRPRLFGIAYRTLGSAAEAEDVVQDAWLRWHGADRSQVRDAGAFLATTTSRLAINVVDSARVRRETSMELRPVEPVDPEADPARAPEERETLELAMRTLLEKLSPAERAVYVLREAFDYAYREIAGILGCSEVNARQLGARARRRLSGEHRWPVRTDEQQRLLDAFVAAAQTGEIADLERLLAVDVAA